ncbi:unnamed protein product [Dibothriocephalus latus]|uniref:Uncharacterized protein n=1 Tax=Dibothriocephalus latus TaxID=60516 RepID=A0A3P7N9W0_DIBLA|nr:unnamed protein product [Dibothriocephalus latus]
MRQSYNRSAPTDRFRPTSGQKTSHLHHLPLSSDPPPPALPVQSGLQKNNANNSALVPVSQSSSSAGNRLLVMPSSSASSSARLSKERKQEYPLKASNHLSSGSVQQPTSAYLNSYLQPQPCCNHAQQPPLPQVVPGHFRGTEAPHNIISSQESPDGTFEISV